MSLQKYLEAMQLWIMNQQIAGLWPNMIKKSNKEKDRRKEL